MRRIFLILIVYLAVAPIAAAQSSAGKRLEFILTRDGLKSVWNAKASISLATPFDRATIASSLPGYDVRNAPAEEGWSVLEVSKDGAVLVRIYGSGRSIRTILARSRTVDELGIRPGDPLSLAYSARPQRCFAGYDIGCMSSYSDNVSYGFDPPKGCDYSTSPPGWPIPDCVKVLNLSNWKP